MMCGIAGLYNFDSSHAASGLVIEEMTSRLSHRGPNGHGVFLDGNVGLGHRRLSVIDVESGAQPMTDALSGRTIVYNGEFFNFSEVRDELRARGNTFRTRSDTEVLLQLASGDIRSWIGRVNGMFAFAIWDRLSRSLTLVRDRFGVKPLYYVETEHGIAFASEIKALIGIACGAVPSMDRDALPEYLAFRYVLEPRTLFKDVRQLPSGHYMRLSPASTRLDIGCYWNERQNSDLALATVSSGKDFPEILSKAVTRRLVSDVPLGSFNSGGVDSSLVTREVRQQRTGELHTFSIGFAEQDFDESKYAAEVARILGTTHHAEVLPPSHCAAMLPAAIWHNDEPLCHSHSVHLMHLSSIASRYVTVVLTGEGADEVFFGYPRLHFPRVARWLGPARLPFAAGLHGLSRVGRSRRLASLAEAIGQPVAPEIDSHRFLPIAALHALCGTADYVGSRQEVLSAVPRDQPALESLLEYERRSYMKSIVSRLDKMTMAYGLEARTPFLDFELVLWSKGLHPREKRGFGWENKRILKREAARYFPRDLVYRRKVGFGVPLQHWFRTEPSFRDMLSDLCSANSFVGSVLPIAAIRDMVSSHCDKGLNQGEALWGLVNLELWAGSILKRPQSRP